MPTPLNLNFIRMLVGHWIKGSIWLRREETFGKLKYKLNIYNILTFLDHLCNIKSCFRNLRNVGIVQSIYSLY